MNMSSKESMIGEELLEIFILRQQTLPALTIVRLLDLFVVLIRKSVRKSLQLQKLISCCWLFSSPTYNKNNETLNKGFRDNCESVDNSFYMKQTSFKPYHVLRMGLFKL